MPKRKVLSDRTTIYCTRKTKAMLRAYKKSYKLGTYEEALYKLLIEN